MTPDLKRRLDAAAEAGGRSQSQEAEIRLQQSFDRQDVLTDAIAISYGRNVSALMIAFGWSMALAGGMAASDQEHRAYEKSRTAGETQDQRNARMHRVAEGDWIADPEAYDTAAETVIAILKAAHPTQRQAPKDDKFDTASFLVKKLVKSLREPSTAGDSTAETAAQIISLSPEIAARIAGTVPRRLPDRTTIIQIAESAWELASSHGTSQPREEFVRKLIAMIEAPHSAPNDPIEELAAERPGTPVLAKQLRRKGTNK